MFGFSKTDSLSTASKSRKQISPQPKGESVTSALVVLLTVPFGLCAAIFALALTGTSINIYSQIGVLMLIGIMAKNSILVVEFAGDMNFFQMMGAGGVKSAAELAEKGLTPSLAILRPGKFLLYNLPYKLFPLLLLRT